MENNSLVCICVVLEEKIKICFSCGESKSGKDYDHEQKIP